MFGFGGFGGDFYGDWGDGDFRSERRGWSDKSQAALRREKEAIALFDSFLASCQTETNFPVTQDVVPATTHLTSACWQTFRRHVESKGCHAKRRQATAEERGKDTRKGKMYVISVTVPVHPSKAVGVENDRKRKAEVEAAKRKEKKDAAEARKKAEGAIREQQRKAKEAAHQAKVQQEYWSIIGPKNPPAVVSSNAAMLLASAVPSAGATLPSSVAAAPASTSNATPSVPITVSAMDLLQYSDKVYKDRKREIHLSILGEQRKLEAKKSSLNSQAEQEYKQAKQTIMNALPDNNSKSCSLCQAKMKIAAAQCVRDDCSTILCKACLDSKMKRHDGYRCTICQQKSMQGLVTVIENIICPGCIEKHRYLTQFEYCRNDCGFLCDDHTKIENCCVCGMCYFCSEDCEIGRCGRCGAKLCSRCNYKEGCMCEGKSQRQILNEELGGNFF